jgi:hypothetical protein
MQPPLTYPIRIGYNRRQLNRKVLIAMFYAVMVIFHWFSGLSEPNDVFIWVLRLAMCFVLK